MFDSKDERFMKLAISLAKKGGAKTKSNPLVGAVIVKGGQIVAKGYHEVYGGAHAELQALRAAGLENLGGATMYVSLEPCCHFGKTPPCSEAIIKSGIARVVVASFDPNPIVAGKGVAKLKQAGIAVDVGLLDEQQRQMNEKYWYYMENKMPFVTMKAAMTLDGKIATKDGNSKWISSEKSRRFTRRMRGEHQGIMVGVNTVIADNPRLTTRIKGEANPLKIVVDPKLKLPLNSTVVENAGIEELTVFTSKYADSGRRAKLEKAGAKIIELEEKDGRLDLRSGLKKLAESGIASILLEGGGSLNFEMLKSNLVQKCVFVVAPKIFGGKYAKTAVEGSGISEIADAVKLGDLNVKRIGGDIFIVGYIK